MSQLSAGPSASTLTRWASLIIIALAVGVLVVYLDGVSVVARWSARLSHVGTLFPPWPGMVAIAVATAALLAFCAAMLRPWRSRTKPYDRLSLLLAAFVLVAVAYIIAIGRDWAVVPSALVAGAWIVSGVMFVVAARAAPLHHSLWLRFPFSLAFAVVTLLLLEALASAAESPRLPGLPAWLRDEFAVVALGLAAIAAATVALLYHDYVYPIAIGAFVAMLPIAGSTRAQAIEMWAFSAAMLVLAIVAAALLARDPRERPHRDRAGVIEGKPKAGKRRRRTKLPAEARRYLLEADSSLMRL